MFLGLSGTFYYANEKFKKIITQRVRTGESITSGDVRTLYGNSELFNHISLTFHTGLHYRLLKFIRRARKLVPL